ncbi:MAG: hypothetical protein ACYC61_00885 [Isosphaeraceae bacterium]
MKACAQQVEDRSMSNLTDPRRLALIKTAFADWQCSGRILFKTVAWRWIRRELGENRTQKGISKLLSDHVLLDGETDEVKERRNLEVEDRLIRDHHYDIRVNIDGRLVYFETVLDDDDPSFPVIWVVSVHDA